MTASREKAVLESRGSTRVAVHSSSGGHETSLSRDSDGRDCVQRVLRVDTCNDPVEDSNVRDLLVEAVGAAYQGSSTLKEQQYKRRQQRQGLAGGGCGSSISGEFYAEGAAVQEKTATSGTCWWRLWEQHIRGVLR